MHLYINLSVTSSLTIIIKTTISLAQCVCVYIFQKKRNQNTTWDGKNSKRETDINQQYLTYRKAQD